jgi:hypothetical protein
MNKEKINEVVAYLADRLKEPSTHAALASAVGYIGLAMDQGVISGFCYLLGGVFTLAGILLKEKS